MECLLCVWHSLSLFLPGANETAGSDQGVSHSRSCPRPFQLSQIPHNQHWSLLFQISLLSLFYKQAMSPHAVSSVPPAGDGMW